MLGIYLILSAGLTLIAGNFFDILRQSYSWWLLPLLLIGFTFLFVIIHVLLVVIMILTTNINKPAKNGDFFRSLVKGILPTVIGILRVKVEYEGLEKLPEEGKILFVCNHQHDFDPAIMINAFPDSKISFIGKKDIYTEMPFIAKAMHRLECLPIDRENDREAAKTIIKAIKRLKDNETSIGLFPEGYTSKTAELLPFRNGSLKIALKSGAPVAVCVIDNMKGIHKRIFLRKTVVKFKLVDVIENERYKDMNTNELGDMIHEMMEKTLNAMRNKKQ